ncbi:hypothetical protein AB0323_11905 [Arthrobacter sp. NPDC080031]|uniref:hypothetical protein n=1 Tax=Arthrobacter sp. NPDC080031 TaxID=3155918 RepID=UPI003450E636
MPSTPTRLSYEARILVVPLGASGDDLVQTMAAGGPTNVRIVADAGQSAASVRDIRAAVGSEVTETVADLAASADMMILLGSDLTQLPSAFVATLAKAARANGVLLAGVLVDQQNWESARGAYALTVLRRELDMLVSVRDVGLATAFIDVLKGGRRKPEADLATTEASAATASSEESTRKGAS